MDKTKPKKFLLLERQYEEDHKIKVLNALPALKLTQCKL